MGFFTEVKPEVFNKEVFKTGRVITMCRVGTSPTGMYNMDGPSFNGIINYVSDKYFSYVNTDGNKYRVNIEEVFTTPVKAYPNTPFKILGIADDVVERKN